MGWGRGFRWAVWPLSTLVVLRCDNHSPPMRQSHISYAMKPVPSPQLPIRPSQTKAMEIIYTAAGLSRITPKGISHNILQYFLVEKREKSYQKSVRALLKRNTLRKKSCLEILPHPKGTSTHDAEWKTIFFDHLTVTFGDYIAPKIIIKNSSLSVK